MRWRNISADRLICCQGYKMQENPLFSWLPLQPAHGEILTCSTASPIPANIINKNKWLLPTISHCCRIGATYEPDIKTPTVQEKSKQLLLDFANHIFKENPSFTCIKHQAGIRPTTLDKQPFIGFHPNHSAITIFNGFGSRGSLLIPWYSQAFADTLLANKPLPQEADIHRYQSLCV